MKSKIKLAALALPLLLLVSGGCGDDPTVENVTLAISVTGKGRVEASAPNAIECGKNAAGDNFATQNCSVTIDKGESITLTATQSDGSVFTIWNATSNGDEFTCTTAKICSVTLTKDTSATATFIP